MSIPGKIFVLFMLLILAIAFFGPFAVMIMGSVQKMRDMAADPLAWIPMDPTIYNFSQIFTQGSFLRWFFNSMIITVIPVLSQLFLCTLLGYIFAKKQFIGREFIFWSMMAIMMVPNQLLIIPKYIMFAKFEWINTYWSVIVLELWTILGVFLVRQFMHSIPTELEQAAYLDGANDFQIFLRIIIPLSMPAIATVGTFAFIANWNDLFTPLIFMTKEDMYPLTVGLASLLTREGNFGLQMAGSVISFIPTFLIFLFFQRYFTEGISLSGMK
ncbi:carbohydrate ABC transporter permease [Paenactinomyces guangxiensis]|uniref:Carbohydrate ABC transporter permease n=2 Tax=Paenactinomyces guangxiensis TaxID=1490290 RepID=A0A7W1WNR9_9BACL|nr:carbohydrate ABC transporter permease [Paenactinomyces guangxiensis]MBH8589847.1 carbohydrate ABC transporter permease [Paenactinomyces guangxiensis]